MDGAALQLPDGPDETESRAICELVVLNGRLSGARISLCAPLTLLGQTPECDVRLNVEGVRPLHCAIAVGRETVTVRDLGGEGGTWVNGEAIKAHNFRNGDLLTVGPFHFRIELSSFHFGGEREALRVQAAAVASQQAALTEEEIRLQQCYVTLEQQEQQLATHLEDRSRELDAQQQRLEEEGQALAADRSLLAEGQALLTLEREGVAAERLRLAKLWDRFKRNWKRSWREREADMAGQAQALGDERQRLDEMRAVLQREEAAVQQCRLRGNAEIELTRRQLEHGWEELAAAQQQWEEGREREEAKLERGRKSIECRQSKLAISEGALKRGREHWTRTRNGLRRECEGLETRVRNLQAQITEGEKQRDLVHGVTPANDGTALTIDVSALRPEPDNVIPVPPHVANLVSQLVDQRRCLYELWERLVIVHRAWSEERLRAQTDLEIAHRRLEELTGALDSKRRDLEAGKAAMRQVQESVAMQRAQLHSWQAKVAMRDASWAAERAGIVGCAAHRETIAEAMKQDLEMLRDKWYESRRRELERLRGACNRQTVVRREYAELWQACQQEKSSVAQEQRKLAAKALAVECWRQELLPRFEDAPAAERRLERYIEHEAGLRAEAEAEFERQQELLRIERGRLEEHARGLDQEEAAIAAREDELTRRLTEFELRQVILADEYRRLHAELESVRCLRNHDQRHISELRDEAERLVQALLEGVVTTASQPGQAA